MPVIEMRITEVTERMLAFLYKLFLREPEKSIVFEKLIDAIQPGIPDAFKLQMLNHMVAVRYVEVEGEKKVSIKNKVKIAYNGVMYYEHLQKKYPKQIKKYDEFVESLRLS